MIFSVIIVNYNTIELIGRCLDSIFAYSNVNELEVVVVDNGSTDGSQAFLESEFASKIKLIKNSLNGGFGVANNQGAREANGDFLFFLNSDTLFKLDVLAGLKKIFINDKVGVVAPILILPDGKKQPYSSGRMPNLKSVLFKKGALDVVDKDEIEWVSGAALAVRKNIFKEIGGFDEKFFMYFEDVDLCKRIISLGYKVSLACEVEVIHYGGASFNDYGKKKKIYYRSQDYFYIKHYGLLARIIVKIARFFFLFFK